MRDEREKRERERREREGEKRERERIEREEREREKRQKRDRRETEERQKRDRRETEERQKRDRRETEERQKRDRRETEERQKRERKREKERERERSRYQCKSPKKRITRPTALVSSSCLLVCTTLPLVSYLLEEGPKNGPRHVKAECHAIATKIRGGPNMSSSCVTQGASPSQSQPILTPFQSELLFHNQIFEPRTRSQALPEQSLVKLKKHR